ncbi:MAG: GtrA family protein [Rhodobacteraceae bacterium]|nr:GtrA family protein [Paracoccaceae bacterium]
MPQLNAEILRYAVVGTSVAIFYVLAYTGLTAVGLSLVVANAVAYGMAILVQYAGQAVYTFRRQFFDAAQASRFFVMTLCGYLAAALITSAIAPALGWPHVQAAVIVAVWIPLQNYIFMKIWVFAQKEKEQEQI